MKVCPLCGSRYSVRIDFCFHDGAVLASAAAPQVIFDASLDPPEPDALSLPEPRRSATPSPARARTPAPLQLIAPPPDAVEGESQSDPPVETDPNGSPLIAPPPPQRRPPEPEPQVVSAPDRPASPGAATPSTALDDDPDESESGRGVPVWVWGALVAAVLIVVGGSAFAVGGMSFVAALTKLPGEPEPAVVVVEPLEFPEEPEPAAAEPELRPRLQLGIQGDGQGADPDTDADTDSVGTDSADSEIADPGTLSATEPTQDPSTAGRADPELAEPGTLSAAAPTRAPGGVDSAGTAAAPTSTGTGSTQDPVATSPAPPAAQAPRPKPAPTPAAEPASPWGAAPSQPATAAAQPAPAPAAPAPAPAGTIKVIVTIQNALPGTVVAIDGQVQPGTPPISTNLTPGKHAFRVTGPSGSAFTLTRDVQPGDDGTFRLVFPQVQ